MDHTNYICFGFLEQPGKITNTCRHFSFNVYIAVQRRDFLRLINQSLCEKQGQLGFESSFSY